ncbi:hypothetical protein GALMADRAFT_783257 [Galerina marginata CBS 339.88]|uniref:Hydrophobin n=1 Tax=Galerina marginata (strain CBS 339.88) TaxID=685588 RepID=A0A067SLT8_GALM3|nr:hypothetical protein GALMADRAFT_783257 [Galerina marginata CBS 339.88]
MQFSSIILLSVVSALPMVTLSAPQTAPVNACVANGMFTPVYLLRNFDYLLILTTCALGLRCILQDLLCSIPHSW